MPSRDRFAYLPQALVESAAFMTLTTRAPMLLALMASRYTGHNNGDLSVTYEELYRKWGWARSTSARAFVELRDRGLLNETRRGGKNVCTLYALGWVLVDDENVIQKLELTGGTTPQKVNEWRIWGLRCVS